MSGIRQYYLDRFGQPQREAEFRSPEGVRIQILKWDSDHSGEGVTLYATDGASAVLGSAQEACEFFTGLTPAVDDIAGALAEVGLTGNGSGDVPASGDSITLAYPLWNGTEARTFLFRSGEDLLPSFRDGRKHIRFLKLVPVFTHEMDYKKLHGEEGLWDKFRRSSVAYWDSTRKPTL